MKTIPLTQGKEAIVDDDMHEFLSKWKWCAHNCGNKIYAIRNQIVSDGRKKTVYLHHVISGFPLGKVVDHQNGNSLDNRRENLLHVTQRSNSLNKPTLKKVSRYPGVMWHKRQERWISHIRIGKKMKWLGTFDSEESAAQAYQEAIPR